MGKKRGTLDNNIKKKKDLPNGRQKKTFLTEGIIKTFLPSGTRLHIGTTVFTHFASRIDAFILYFYLPEKLSVEDC